MSQQLRVPKRLVALGLTGKPIPQLITDTEHYVQSMTGNLHFPTPSPALTVISADLDLVKASLAVAQTRTRGATDKLHADAKVLHLGLKSLATYVEGIANADPDHAADIILSAGMLLKKPAVRQPKGFSVKLTKNHGEALIDSKATKGGFYFYEMSTDPTLAEASWVRIYQGSKVKFVKSGLTSGTRYFFRAASIVKTIQGTWSPVVSVVMQ